MEEMLNALDKVETMTEFNDALFKELVELITITSDRKAEIAFKCGVIITAEIK